MARDIHNFVQGNMDWEGPSDLWGRVSESEEWVDYLLMEMELYNYYHQTSRITEYRELSFGDGLIESTVKSSH